MFGWLKRGAQPAATAVAQAPEGSAAQAAAWRRQGSDHLANDNFEAAAQCLARAAHLEPADAATLVNLGFAQCQLGRAADAVRTLAAALALEPRNHDALYFLGVAQEQGGDTAAAMRSFAAALELQPAFEAARGDLCRLHAFQGMLWARQHQHGKAVRSFRDALALAPADAQLHAALGSALLQQGDVTQAKASYLEAIRIDAAYAAAHSDLGDIHRIQGDLAQAAACCERAIAIDPRLAAAHNNLGAIQMALGDAQRALASFDRALALAPPSAGAMSNRAMALMQLDRLDLALEAHDRAVELDPRVAGAWNNRGSTLLALHRAEQALSSFDAALALEPGNASAHNYRGNALQALGRGAEALASYDAALAAEPRHAQALTNRANMLAHAGRLAEADASYAMAVASDPGYAEAWFNRGNALRNAGRLTDAFASYERALALKPSMPFLYGNWLHVKMHMCDWQDMDACFTEFAARVDEGQVFNPFTAIATDLGAAAQKILAENYARNQFGGGTPGPQAGVPASHERIRIGYFSADLQEHATAYLMAELFEKHDRGRFELFAFSFGPPAQGAMRQRLERAFDHFLDVSAWPDGRIAAKARELGIHIAVDLKGYTHNSRTGIFAARAAPVQVSYLGYPGTMGAPFIDYLIADATVITPAHRAFYSEKIVTVPGSYQANDSGRAIAPLRHERQALGLPDTGFVFCCFNNSYKITPAIFGLWMRLLRDVPGSTLWLLDGNHEATRNLRSAAAGHGIAPERLVFAPRMDLPLHLARHRAADLFLDTVFCNAHTTASDALWAGLPVLTCMGETFAGRVAASLLTALDLQELVTESLEEYEAAALRLARDGALLQSLKERLAVNRDQKPLFKGAELARHLEAAYAKMMDLRRSGLEPAHIDIKPDAAH